MKNARLEELATVINDALISGSDTHRPTVATPLLTRQEEKVLTMWMDGASNQKIAAHLSINGKTVYAKPADLKKIQRHFGLVFQNFNLFPHYSVLKNIYLEML